MASSSRAGAALIFSDPMLGYMPLRYDVSRWKYWLMGPCLGLGGGKSLFVSSSVRRHGAKLVRIFAVHRGYADDGFGAGGVGRLSGNLPYHGHQRPGSGRAQLSQRDGNLGTAA